MGLTPELNDEMGLASSDRITVADTATNLSFQILSKRLRMV
jgi:hypothetical protein